MKKLLEHYAAGESLYNKVVAPVCEEFDLTHMELTIIMFLANNAPYDTATDIVKFRRLTKSHVSISIRSLVERGYLSSEYKGQNRRTIHLSLTPNAKVIVDAGRAAQKTFREILYQGFTVEEIDAFHSMMDRIDRNMEYYSHIQTGEKANG